MQAFLFVLSVVVGLRMTWLVNHGSWLANMQQVNRCYNSVVTNSIYDISSVSALGYNMGVHHRATRTHSSCCRSSYSILLGEMEGIETNILNQVINSLHLATFTFYY